MRSARFRRVNAAPSRSERVVASFTVARSSSPEFLAASLRRASAREDVHRQADVALVREALRYVSDVVVEDERLVDDHDAGERSLILGTGEFGVLLDGGS